jgi:hypothetical protein
MICRYVSIRLVTIVWEKQNVPSSSAYDGDLLSRFYLEREFAYNRLIRTSFVSLLLKNLFVCDTYR